jgi:hypothetical protein
LNAGLQHGQRLAQSLLGTGCRDEAGDWEVMDVKPWKKA